MISWYVPFFDEYQFHEPIDFIKIYGVSGDTNGDDDIPLVGEASLSLATPCYGKVVNGEKRSRSDRRAVCRVHWR